MSENIKRIGSTSEGVLYVLIGLLFIAPQLSDSSRSSLGVSSGNGPSMRVFNTGCCSFLRVPPLRRGRFHVGIKIFKKELKKAASVSDL